MATTERTNSRYVSRINEITEICVCNDKLVFSVVVVFGIIYNCFINYTCVWACVNVNVNVYSIAKSIVYIKFNPIYRGSRTKYHTESKPRANSPATVS